MSRKKLSENKLIAVVGLIGVVIVAIIGIKAATAPVELSIRATQTAEAKLTLVASSATSPTPPATATNTPTNTLTNTPVPPTNTSAPESPIPTNTPTSTPYPTPVLVSPDEGISFPVGQDVKLVWKEQDLAENEFFEVRIRLRGGQRFNRIARTKMSSEFVSAELTKAGTYEWQVAIVSLSGEEKSVSQIRSFKVR